MLSRNLVHPGFDSECYSKCKEKDMLRKKFKQTKNLADGIKFTKCRKDFKNLVKDKIRDNICGLEDNNVISKTFLEVCQEYFKFL